MKIHSLPALHVKRRGLRSRHLKLRRNTPLSCGVVQCALWKTNLPLGLVWHAEQTDRSTTEVDVRYQQQYHPAEGRAERRNAGDQMLGWQTNGTAVSVHLKTKCHPQRVQHARPRGLVLTLASKRNLLNCLLYRRLRHHRLRSKLRGMMLQTLSV